MQQVAFTQEEFLVADVGTCSTVCEFSQLINLQVK